MTDQELDRYMQEEILFFTSEKMMTQHKSHVEFILELTSFGAIDRRFTLQTLESLCFTLETERGRKLYLSVLTHIAKYCPDLAEKYWKIYDNQENLKERYRT